MPHAKSVLVILALPLLAIPSTARPCTSPNQVSPISIALIRNGPGSGIVVASGYETFGTGAGVFCACGLAPIDTACVVSVNSATVVNAGTNTPIAGFSFNYNGVTTSSLTSALNHPNWAGFSSSISTAVPAGTPIDIRFNLTLNPACSDPAVLQKLHGNNGARIGTDKANADGSLMGAHQFILSPVVPSLIPTLAEWGVILLALGLATLGIWTLRRRSAAMPG